MIHPATSRLAATTTLPRFLAVSEVAQSLNVSEQTVRRLFQDRPGVLRISKGQRLRGKRQYTTLRIPESVFQSVIREMSA